MTVKAEPEEQGMTRSSGLVRVEIFSEDVGAEIAGAGVVDGLDEGDFGADGAAEIEPGGVVAEVLRDECAEDLVGVAADCGVDPGMALGELGGVAVDVDDLAGGNELLPIEAGLLEREAGAEGDEEIGLLHEDVGVAHAPGVGTAEVHWVRGVKAVRGVPGEHDGDAGGSELLLEGLGGIARDAGAEQEDRTLGSADAGDEVGEDGFGDGFEVRGECGMGVLRVVASTLAPWMSRGISRKTGPLRPWVPE